MEITIIASFFLGLMFGGIATAAVSINEIKRLRKMLPVKKFESEVEVFEK